MRLIPKKYEYLVYEAILPRIGYFIINGVFSTIPMRWLNDALLWENKQKGQPVIFAVWHNRLAYVAYGYSRVFNRTRENRNLVSIISRSKDGKVLGRIMELMGLRAAYGSTTRGGSEALRELIRLVNEEKLDCGITPDGPKGPRYKVQPGVISVAQATGAPILPLACDVKHKIKLRSWDGFYVPLPFTKGVVWFEKPLSIPPVLSDDDRQAYQLELEHRLDVACKRAADSLKTLKL